ncbi:MAG: AAA family ATPase, partial [bacterium]|nr:AAA family ATPase [bacterium]
MKIAKINLKGYNQFSSLDIDLTYPKGHEKEGEPLDKVCIIGQSGTGKTSLLRLIKWFVSRDRQIGENVVIEIPDGAKVTMEAEVSDLKFTLTNTRLAVNERSFRRIGEDRVEKRLPAASGRKALRSYIENINPILLNYPTELITKRDIDGGRDENGDMTKEDYLDQLKPGQIVDFAFEDIDKAWHLVLKEIKEHRARALLMKNKIAETAGKQEVTLQEIEEQTTKYKEWLRQNPSPLRILAQQCLDPILSGLGVKIKEDIALESILDLGFIELQTLDGRDIPRDVWSTGTWQLVQTLMPLYQLKPGNAVILIDEPERSLYPDMQIDMIASCVKLAPESQFFFATHSPMVASAFEPWEIVELKFDTGNISVSREPYYDGQNRVNNYKYHPGYLRWDSILRHIFDMEAEGSEKREAALHEITGLMSEIGELKKNNRLESEAGRKVVDRYLELGK